MKNIQLYRKITQIFFLILLAIGIYMDAKIAIMLLIPGAFIFGNFFCGWVCPYGTMQDLFGRLGKKLIKRQFKMPIGIQKYLQYSRYILMIISMTGIISIFFDSINGYKTFFSVFSDGIILSVASVMMISFIIIGIFFERPFCNYFCSEGVKFGLFSLTRIFSIKRNVETCVGCKKCDKACPMNINVSAKEQIRHGQCINCFECINACPVKNTLTYDRVKLPVKKRSKSEQS